MTSLQLETVLTPYGPVSDVHVLTRWPGGAPQDCRLLEENSVPTPQGWLVALYDPEDVRRSSGKSFSLYPNGMWRTLELQRQIWARTVMADREATNPVSSGLFVSAINTLIDVHTERLAALENHVPEVILFLLIFVASATLAITGYRAGLCGVRLVIPRAIVVALIVATLAVIVDLDRPRRGFIKVSENALLELKASLRAP